MIQLCAGTQPTRLNSSRVGWVPVTAQTARIFYRAADWLSALPETQMHLTPIWRDGPWTGAVLRHQPDDGLIRRRGR